MLFLKRNRDYTDTPPDSEDEGQESIEFTSSEEESHGKFFRNTDAPLFLVLIIFLFLEESSDEYDDI